MVWQLGALGFGTQVVGSTVLAVGFSGDLGHNLDPTKPSVLGFPLNYEFLKEPPQKFRLFGVSGIGHLGFVPRPWCVM